ncbi:MAG: hypothetical protein ACYSWU_00315 [Planctomycetota bacterium]|jgi:hypothetical protein
MKKKYSDDVIRSLAISEAIKGMDEAMVFTNPECQVFRAPDDGAVMAQVWIALPREYWDDVETKTGG